MMDEEITNKDLWSFGAQDEVLTTTSRIETKGIKRRLTSAVPAPPTASQIARLRLILSTYQDGTGQLPASDRMTLPGWRDFERVVAAAFDGQA